MNCPSCKKYFDSLVLDGIEVLTCNKCKLIVELIYESKIFFSIIININESCLSINNTKLIYNIANDRFVLNNLISSKIYCKIHNQNYSNSLLIEDKIKEIFSYSISLKQTMYAVNQVEVNKLVALLKSIEENICFA